MLKRALKRILRREEGSALVVAIGAMGVIAILSALTAAAATQVAESSNKDRRSKRAFAATEAALQMANYRLNMLAPPDEQCVTDLVAAPVGGVCTASGRLGDGTEWTYHMTPVLTSGKCAGYTVVYGPDNPEYTVAPRCVTVTGRAGGVTRRAQARMGVFKGAPIFPARGLLGINGLSIKNTANVTGFLASNGKVELGNGSTVTEGILLAPGAPPPDVGNSSIAVRYRTAEQGGWTLAPVEIGNSATVNDNVSGWTLSSDASYSYDAATRQMTLTKGTLTLLGGTYNFCNLTIGNNAKLVVASGNPAPRAVVFIDSAEPERAAVSGCPAGTGRLVISNNVSNPGTAENLQFYVYGADPVAGTPAVEVNNSSAFNMAIHAPRATVSLKNGGNMTFNGAVNASIIQVNNSISFAWQPRLWALRTLKTTHIYQRTAWRECRSAPSSGSDQMSGC